MNGKDRTNEFMSVIKYAQTRNPMVNRTFSRKSLQNTSDFFVISKKITKDIANTQDKLVSLHSLIDREIDQSYQVSSSQLSDIIRVDLNALNKQIAQLQQFLRNKSISNKQRYAHSSSIIVTLQSRLAQMSTDFKVILEIKQQRIKDSQKNITSLKNEQQREEVSNCSPNGIINNSNISHSNITTTQKQTERNQYRLQHYQQQPTPQNINSNLPQKMNSHQTNMYKKYDYYDNRGQEHHHQQQQRNVPMQQPQYYGGDNSNHQQQQQQQMLRQRFVQEEKADEMVSIEQTIVELGGIFQQLATMVHEQGEMVCRIDSHTDETQLNVEEAHTELVKYLHNIATTRSFLIKVFIILILFFTFFIYLYR